MPISDFITQTIITASPPVGLPSLVIPMVACVLSGDEGTAWTAEYGSDLVVSVSPSTWQDVLETLGVVAGEDLFEALTDMFSQRLSDGTQAAPEEVLLGRRATPVALVRTAVVGASAGAGNYTTTINGTAFVVPYNTSANQTATDIRAAINAGSEPVTASGAGANVILTADVAGVPFTSSVAHSTTPADYTITTTTANVGIGEDIADWRAEDDRWTWLLDTTRTPGVQQYAAETCAALTRPRLVVLQTSDALAQDGGSTDDLASLLGSAGLGLTDVWIFYHDDSNEFVDFAMVGYVCGAGLPGDVGTVHVGLRSVTGLTAAQLTSTSTLTSKRYSWLERYDAFVPPETSTKGGRTLGNLPIDIYLLILDLNVRIPARLYQRFRGGDVPYTGGEPIVESVIRSALGERTGPPGQAAIVEGSIVVTVPDAGDQDEVDILARLYRDVTWGCTAQGKLEAVAITGYLSQGE